MNNTQEIDFVVSWVDGGDENWRKEKAKYSPYGDVSVQRYRDWDIFQYWFRGVEKFAPWVRKVHFVTWGHLPKWLNTENPKLNIVNHSDYMPEEYLPTFSSRPIELNLHRIKGISEQFVYFNDDMQIIKPIKPTDFFVKGLPVDMLALQPVIANPHSPTMSYTFFNNSNLLCKYFDKRECMKQHPGKFFNPAYPIKYLVYNWLETAFPMFTGFYDSHGPTAHLKSTFEEVWECEGELLDRVSRNKFRSSADVNQYAIRDWRKLKGNFKPANMHRKCSYIEVSKGDVKKRICSRPAPIICINDSYLEFDFDSIRQQVYEALDSIMPEKSSFEK